MILTSASQITTFRDCRRKWAWRYIAGKRPEQHASAALGTEVDDEQLQPLLRDGRPLDFSRPSGEIAHALTPYLPPPMSPGLEVQRHFILPSPTHGEVFGFQGYLDLWLPDSRVVPGMPGGAPFVGDFKTTGDLRWAKDEGALAGDVQWTMYATHALFVTQQPAVDTAWMYSRTRGARKAQRTHLRVISSADDAAGLPPRNLVHVTRVLDQFLSINATAVEMLAVRESGAQPLDLEPSPDHCDGYGGCPFRADCNLSPDQIIGAQLARLATTPPKEIPTMSDAPATETMSALQRLHAKKKAAAAAPAPEPEPTPPAWTQDKEPYKGAAAAAVGINPPEKELPPAPPVGTHEAAPAEPKRRGPGRPKKEEASLEMVAEAVIVDSVTVAAGTERYEPVPGSFFEVGPFSCTTTVRPGESIADASKRARAELDEVIAAERTKKAEAFAAALEAVS